MNFAMKMSGKGKSKNFTVTEKRYLTEILKNYAHVIECKKSDAMTLKEKEEAWAQICDEYNNSTIIIEKRNVMQLKKLWTNLKQQQRDALTKERQSRLATGGGPEGPTIIIDPNISSIVPNLMTTAPILFSSNLLEEVMEERHNELVDSGNPGQIIDALIHHDAEDDNMNNISEIVETSSESQNPTPTSKRRKRVGVESLGFDEEKKLRVERLKMIMKQEQEAYELKRRYDEEIHIIALREAKAKAALAELLLKNEMNKD